MKQAYSIQEAKELIPFGTTKIYEAINAGDLIVKKYGRKTVILHSDLQTFLTSLPSYEPNKREETK
jgi:hypothetical protein